MKILFAGSPEAAKITLEFLVENQKQSGFEIAGVLSNPPTAKGRHKTPTPTPVAEYALSKGLPVFTPEHLDSAAREQIAPLGADLLVCFAYGHIFGPKFLDLFPMGGINLHPSFLPKYRGCTPVQQAILEGDELLGISIQTLSLKMDAGDILKQDFVNIKEQDTTESLLNYSALTGAKLICKIIEESAAAGSLIKGKPQSKEDISYTYTITKDMAKINWSESAQTICRKIRAYYPDPCCWCLEENDSTLKLAQAKEITLSDAQLLVESDPVYAPLLEDKVFQGFPYGKVLAYNKNTGGIFIKTGDGILCVTKLQRQGKTMMNYKDFMNGAKNFIGTILK
ncbi:MAG: methionyl-tRNA formyltransferase [Treponema sp.]|nr:methionyl-tRNA formyltransferase [Treponema sp.]